MCVIPMTMWAVERLKYTMRRVFLMMALVWGLTLQAADLYVTPDSSLADAVRKAREMHVLSPHDLRQAKPKGDGL